MKLTLGLILVLFGLNVFGSTTLKTTLVPEQNDNSVYGYEMAIDLKMNGKHMGSPTLSAMDGGTVTITEETKNGTYFLEATPTESTSTNNERSVHMKFVVGTIDAKGKKTILSTPQINTLENLKAEVGVGHNPNKPDLLTLSVIAKRKKM